MRYLYLILLGVGLTACSQSSSMDVSEPYVAASNTIDAGKYLVIIGGCNDCHTEGYLQTEGKIPEDDWMTGSRLGWRGPWGTTYPVNLRLRVQELTKEQWITQLKERKANPPMPWMNVNLMHPQDAGAIYDYLKEMGPKGEHVPTALGPDQEPQTPYLSLMPQNLPGQ